MMRFTKLVQNEKGYWVQVECDGKGNINPYYGYRWTCLPHHQPKTKVKSLEFYEDVIRRAIVCELVLSDRKPVIGIARCHPKDKYDEEIGYKMALTKAMADMSRETRAIVWKYYFRKIAKE